jgi:hypothetical protein
MVRAFFVAKTIAVVEHRDELLHTEHHNGVVSAA